MADGGGGDGEVDVDEWAHRTAEERLSSARPAPAERTPERVPLPQFIVDRAIGVRINPPDYDWAGGNLVPLECPTADPLPVLFDKYKLVASA